MRQPDLHRIVDIEDLRRYALLYQSQFSVVLRRLAQVSRQLEQLTGQPVVQPVFECLQESLASVPSPAAPTQPDAPAATEEPVLTSETGTEPAAEPKPKARGHGPRPQPKLKTVTRLFELDAADQVCPSCGGELRAIAGQYESSEMIDVTEVKYELVVVQRQKYSCRCGGCVETALGPERVQDGGRYSLDFAIKVAIDKYLHHIPLERQVRMMAEQGLAVDSQTLWDQVFALSRHCLPTWSAIRQHILSQPVIGLDQTGWPNLDKEATKLWQMWCLTARDAVYHQICDDKSAKSFADVVGEYRGTIVCDAFSTHAKGARDSPGITLAGCWAHTYRKFKEALPDFREARVALDLIKKLYEVDDRATSDVEREELRRTQSRVHLDALFGWLELKKDIPRTTRLGEAIQYTRNHWEALTRFAFDPAVWLDNNRTERGLRGPVVGRRNHFGSKSKRGTQTAAIFYTLVETAKLAGVPAAKYLRAIALAERSNKGATLLPHQILD